jgi:hypothetical protein
VTPEWLIYAAVVCAGVGLTVALIGPRRALSVRHLALPYLAVTVVTYLLRPLLVVGLGGGFWFLDRYFYACSRFDGMMLPLMGLSVAAAMLSFGLGYRALRRPPIVAAAPGAAESGAHASRSALAAMAIILVGYASFAVSHRGFVGISENALVYSRHQGMGAYANSNGYFEMANYLVVTGAILLFAATNRLWLAALVSAPWLYNQVFFGWSRHKALALVVGILAVQILRGGRRVAPRTRLLATAGAACLVLLGLVAMRQNRFFLSEGRDIGQTASETFSMPIDRATGDLDGFEPAWVTLHQVATLDKTYGLEILYTCFVVLVPRQLWPGKPWPTDFTWSRLFDAEHAPAQDKWPVGAVRGSIGDALRDWGWPGLFIDFYLTGLLLGWAERRYVRTGRTPAATAAYAAAFALVPLLGRDGVWHILPDYVYLFLVPCVLADAWVRRNRSVDAAPARRGPARRSGEPSARLRHEPR